MHPILFELAGVPIRSYGFALFMAFAVGIYVAKWRAEKRALNGECVLELGIVILLTSLAGSRLLWALTHLERFRAPDGTWTDVFNPFQDSGLVGISGLSMMGGVPLALVSGLAYLRLRGLPVLRYADVVAPSVALGEGLTRVGCFLNGCCFGTACELPWAVRFPPGSAAAATFGEALLHPTQLYASLAAFATFGALLWLAPRTRRDGIVVLAFLVLAGAGRILLDLVRHYETQVIVLRLHSTGITINQVISAGLRTGSHS